MKYFGKLGVFLAAGMLSLASTCLAGDFPDHAIRVLVGYPPGGAPDVVARIVGQRLSQILKQAFVVENKPGAGGTIAATVVAKAPADGYTILFGDAGQFSIAPWLFKDLPYDPIKGFTPIGQAAVVPMVLAAKASTGIKTVADLVRLAKASPGKLTYASSGVGSIHHIAMEMFKDDAGIDVTHVPYKGSGQSVPALLGGEVQVAMTAYPALGSYAKNGQVNILAVTSAKRYAGTPEVPALSEIYPGYDYASEIGVVGPAGMPPQVVVMAEPGIQEKLAGVGAIASWQSPQDFGVGMQKNLLKYKKAVEISHAVQN